MMLWSGGADAIKAAAEFRREKQRLISTAACYDPRHLFWRCYQSPLWTSKPSDAESVPISQIWNYRFITETCEEMGKFCADFGAPIF
jgi:hypothetical protein